MNCRREELIERLDRIEALARASRRRRLMHQPFRYLQATLFHRFLYPRLSRGWHQKAATFFDRPMQLILPAATDIFLLGAKTHDSEIRLTRFMLRHLKAGATFIDVGAHYGFYSLLAACLTGEKGRVLALEAGPRNFELLKANLEACPNAAALHTAASDHNGSLTFYEFPTLYSEYNSAVPPPSDQARLRPRTVEVPCRRLDDLLFEKGLQPDLIKIDVEGAENLVLRGLERWLQKNAHPCIALEYLPATEKNSPHRQAIEMLRGYGLQPFAIDPAGYIQACPDITAHLQRHQLDSDNIIMAKETGPMKGLKSC